MSFRFRPILWGIILIFTLVILGCINDTEDYTKVESIKSQFVLGLTSYLDLNEVIARLSLDGERLVVTDQSEASSQLNVPPFKYVTATVNEIKIDKYLGALELIFFNDRLLEIRFFPKNFQDYVTNIPGLSDFDPVEIDSHTKIWIGSDHNNRQFVAWTDKRLEEQFNRWIKYYS